MNNHVCLKRRRLPGGRCPHSQLTGTLFNSYRFGSKMKGYAEFASSLDKLINEIGIKKREGTLATM
jgi:hypothetical protein